jgi:NADH dehydrogenase [ubiquinone] 1 alpha subcomplex assembly factor 5
MALRSRALTRFMPRALDKGIGQAFLMQHMADELAERLDCVSRDFGHALLIGPIAQCADRILGKRKMAITAAAMINEEQLPYAPSEFDLIISAGTLDSVNDLPGALVQIRQCLQPDGLFLGTLFGAGSLTALKSAMLLADGDKPSAHIHPQIDLRMASELVTRAGFALPVCDLDSINVRYSSWRTLVRDLRDAGIGNALGGQRHYLGQDYRSRLDKIWQDMARGDDRVTETFNFLQISGWAPSANQPKPAARGSGAVSLAAILPMPRRDG